MSNIELAGTFSSYCVRKVADIRVNIEKEQGTYQASQEYLPPYASSLSSIMIANEQEIDTLIKKLPSKSCQLDLIPT